MHYPKLSSILGLAFLVCLIQTFTPLIGAIYYPPPSTNYSYGSNPYYSPHGAVDYYSPYDEWFYINSGTSFQLDAPYTPPTSVNFGSYPMYQSHSSNESREHEADLKSEYGNDNTLVTPTNIQDIGSPRSTFAPNRRVFNRTTSQQTSTTTTISNPRTINPNNNFYGR